MRPVLMIAAIALAVVGSAVHAAGPVSSLGLGDAVEPNRLTANPKNRPVDTGRPGLSVTPYMSLGPGLEPAPPPERRSGPGFLNADPFDPNSVVNRAEREMYWNPYPYHPMYNPYGQGSSPHAPLGGGSVPMGNGIPSSR